MDLASISGSDLLNVDLDLFAARHPRNFLGHPLYLRTFATNHDTAGEP